MKALPSSIKANATSNDNQHPRLKILVVGGTAVGKSSIIQRYSESTFSTLYKATYGGSKSCFLWSSSPFGKRRVQSAWVELLELSHAELGGRFEHVAHHLEGVAGVIIVFDSSDFGSLRAVDEWRSFLSQRFYGREPDMVLVGTKIDKQPCVVSLPDLQTFAEGAGFYGCFLTSAKTGENLKEHMDRFLLGVLWTRQASNPRLYSHTAVPSPVTLQAFINGPGYSSCNTSDMSKPESCPWPIWYSDELQAALESLKFVCDTSVESIRHLKTVRNLFFESLLFYLEIRLHQLPSSSSSTALHLSQLIRSCNEERQAQPPQPAEVGTELESCRMRWDDRLTVVDRLCALATNR
eukprot:GILK01010038.1.p1 GENE.GILK01010038.1~~GILK01010038.1.p1  ORF type:complete len:393 (+),score=44.33 GILK01010038.1:127-1179(+)